MRSLSISLAMSIWMAGASQAAEAPTPRMVATAREIAHLELSYAHDFVAGALVMVHDRPFRSAQDRRIYLRLTLEEIRKRFDTLEDEFSSYLISMFDSEELAAAWAYESSDLGRARFEAMSKGHAPSEAAQAAASGFAKSDVGSRVATKEGLMAGEIQRLIASRMDSAPTAIEAAFCKETGDCSPPGAANPLR